MSISKRGTIVEMFSTFLQLDQNSDLIAPSWKSVATLEKSMIQQIKNNPNFTQEQWASYWLNEVLNNQQHNLAKNHLSAYLEEACYWMAWKVCQQLSTANITQVDCFLIAREVTANPAKIFKNYDSSRSSLKTYAQFPIKRIIIEKIRTGSEVQGYSPTGMLRSVSKKELKEVLEKDHIKEPRFSECLLAYQCFRELYIPTHFKQNRQLKPPNTQQFTAIASRYNQLRARGNLTQDINNQELEKLLNTCVDAIRRSLTICTVSLEEETLTSESIFSDVLEESQALTDEWQQINTILANEFISLPSDAQKILKFTYGLDLTQTDIAKLVDSRQDKICRKISQYKLILLQALARWLQENLKVILTPQKINEMLKPLEEWLKIYCPQEFQQFLARILLEDFKSEIKLLQLLLGEKLKLGVVAKKLNISEADVTDKLLRVRQHLQEKLKQWVETTQSVELNISTNVDKRLATFVEEWLKNAPYATFR